MGRESCARSAARVHPWRRLPLLHQISESRFGESGAALSSISNAEVWAVVTPLSLTAGIGRPCRSWMTREDDDPGALSFLVTRLRTMNRQRQSAAARAAARPPPTSATVCSSGNGDEPEATLPTGIGGDTPLGGAAGVADDDALGAAGLRMSRGGSGGGDAARGDDEGDGGEEEDGEVLRGGAAIQSNTIVPSTVVVRKCPLTVMCRMPVFSSGHCGAGGGAEVHVSWSWPQYVAQWLLPQWYTSSPNS